jgi:hypothetical protein
VPLVQSKSGSITSGTTLTLTLAAGTTAGNCLVNYIGEAQGTTNPVVSGITLGGSAGNYVAAKKAINNADANAEIWVNWNCAGSQTAIVVTFTAGTGISQGNEGWAEEWSAILATSNPVDKTNGGNGSSAAPTSGSTGTLTQPNEVVVGCICSLASITGPSTPWTNQAQVTAGGSNLVAGHQVVTATTAQTYSGTTASAVWGAVVVSLLEAAAATPATFTPPHTPLRGPGSARPGRTARAAVLAPPAPTPAAFTAPHAPLRGARAAAAGKPSRASVLAPFVTPPTPTPALFAPPHSPLRGPGSAARGRLASYRVLSPVITVIVPKYLPAPDILKPWRKRQWPRVWSDLPDIDIDGILRLRPPASADADAEAAARLEQADIEHPPGRLERARSAVWGVAADLAHRAADAADPGPILQDPDLAAGVAYWTDYRRNRRKPT